jgi:hypothetical protein
MQYDVKLCMDVYKASKLWFLKLTKFLRRVGYESRVSAIFI